MNACEVAKCSKSDKKRDDWERLISRLIIKHIETDVIPSRSDDMIMMMIWFSLYFFFTRSKIYLSDDVNHTCVGPKANNVSSTTTYDTVIFRFRVIPTSSPTPRVSSARSLAMGQLGRRRWSSATPPMTIRNTISRRCTIFIRVSLFLIVGNRKCCFVCLKSALFFE